ncbi:MAG: hypothetical protein SVS85_00290 [Candidatus Nanohaloarchaea archaeon]|nr:hypothetical protein [Candidatus Nanohaloarchaea archaeon]
MSETLFEFKEGPYEILDYEIKTDDGKVTIEVNDGDLGRLPIENMETVRELREALLEVEAYFKEVERRSEEL